MSNDRFNFNQEPIDKLSFKIIYVTSSKFENDWHSTLHTHHFIEFFYVLNGTGNFVVEEKIFRVRENDFVIINPNVEHTEKSYNSSPLEYIAIGIEGLEFEFKNIEEELRYQLYNFTEMRSELLLYFNALLSELEKELFNYEDVCKNLLKILITKILRATNCSFSVTSSFKTIKECAIIKRYIDINFAEELDLDELANIAHINKFYLVHSFTKYTGMSPISYLISKRIQQSKNLLESTNYSISQISDLVGFSSQSYFSQSFKRATTLSPNDYRKLKKNEQDEKS